MSFSQYGIYKKHSNYILGFHGCDESVAKKLLANPYPTFKYSLNDYDWLGRGMYFWESDPHRALSYIKEVKKRQEKSGKNLQHRIKNPAVIGAVLDLGNCINLMENRYIDTLGIAYKMLIQEKEEQKLPVPTNKPSHSKDCDFLLRYLDKQVIEILVALIEKESNTGKIDSIKAMFREGNAIYQNAGFYKKDHIQIAIRNPDMIKGYFKPIENHILVQTINKDWV